MCKKNGCITKAQDIENSWKKTASQLDAKGQTNGALPAMWRTGATSSRLPFLWHLSWYSGCRNRRRV